MRFKAGHPSGFIEAFANYYFDTADSLGAYLDNNGHYNPHVFGIDEALEGIKMLEAIADSYFQQMLGKSQMSALILPTKRTGEGGTSGAVLQ